MPVPSEDLVHAVGRRIANLRQERGLTQDELARRLGIAVKNVQRLESGRQNMTLRTLESVAVTLGVSPKALLEPAGSNVPWMRKGGASAWLAALTSVGFLVSSHELPRPRGAIPFLTLHAAASPPAPDGEVDVIAWLLPGLGTKKPVADSFVASVRGTSMEPRIPNGSLCLFRPVRGNDLVDRVLLVQHREIADVDTGGSYTVKRVASVERRKGGGVKVRLEPFNRRFKPIEIEARTEDELRPIAELSAVLWSPLTARG